MWISEFADKKSANNEDYLYLITWFQMLKYDLGKRN